MTLFHRSEVDDSEDELPEIAVVLGQRKGIVIEQRSETAPRARGNEGSNPDRTNIPIEPPRIATNKDIKHTGTKIKRRPLGPLTVTNPNPLFFRLHEHHDEDKIRSSPRRAVKANVKYAVSRIGLTDDEVSTCNEDDTFTDLSGFIVSDSENLSEAVSKTPPGKTYNRSSMGLEHQISRNTKKIGSANGLLGKEESPIIDLISPHQQRNSHDADDRREALADEPSTKLSATLDLDEPFALLRFSPPRSRSPHKRNDEQRPVTPPLSPIKSRLQSPSKKASIPPTPHRPSIDAFWSQDVINDWNDQYSPRKTPKSVRRHPHILLDDSDGEVSPSTSPPKSPTKSPAKKDITAIAQRKAFNDRKHDLATSFLTEVDHTITNDQVAQLSSSTGGIHIIWSKKLSSTAGRANWRREAIRHPLNNGTTTTATHHHHATIELAEKVIDDEDRLMNVIAHEYCHLATFMISGVKNNPHGKEFKSWAAKCTKAFGNRGVDVTTKHSYAIAYKYIWVCENAECGIEYKRHSKSIDPAKHTCGKCKGRLLQIQPAPRKGPEVGKRSEYQEFVKGEYERIRMENPGKGFGELMIVLGREFRERKKVGVAVKGVVEVGGEHEDGDGMMKKLGELSLAA